MRVIAHRKQKTTDRLGGFLIEIRDVGRVLIERDRHGGVTELLPPLLLTLPPATTRVVVIDSLAASRSRPVRVRPHSSDLRMPVEATRTQVGVLTRLGVDGFDLLPGWTGIRQALSRPCRRRTCRARRVGRWGAAGAAGRSGRAPR
jgi:hypothetical protein